MWVVERGSAVREGDEAFADGGRNLLQFFVPQWQGRKLAADAAGMEVPFSHIICVRNVFVVQPPRRSPIDIGGVEDIEMGIPLDRVRARLERTEWIDPDGAVWVGGRAGRW